MAAAAILFLDMYFRFLVFQVGLVIMDLCTKFHENPSIFAKVMRFIHIFNMADAAILDFGNKMASDENAK